jgi:phage internal scaffolding protein
MPDSKLKRERERVYTKPVGVSRTEQSHKKKCNVNNVISRYYKTGNLDSRMQDGCYGDFTNVSDFQTCLHRVMDANDDFMALPAVIRKRFSNSPANLIEFLSDEANRDEAVKLGIIPEPVQTADEPPSLDPPTSEASGQKPITTPNVPDSR